MPEHMQPSTLIQVSRSRKRSSSGGGSGEKGDEQTRYSLGPFVFRADMRPGFDQRDSVVIVFDSQRK